MKPWKLTPWSDCNLLPTAGFLLDFPVLENVHPDKG